MKLTKRQRENLSRALFNLSAIVFAGAILGPLIAPGQVRLSIIIPGFIFFLTLFFVALYIDKGE